MCVCQEDGGPSHGRINDVGGFVFWARWSVPLSKWSNDVTKIHERPLSKAQKKREEGCSSRRLSVIISSWGYFHLSNSYFIPNHDKVSEEPNSHIMIASPSTLTSL
jgi:hypothetical protein